MRTGTICLPLDPERPPTAAVATGAALARRLDLDLDLVASPGVSRRGGARAYLELVADDLRSSGLVARCGVLDEESAATAILDHVAEQPVDLLCMATRASHGPVHLVFGSVAETVMARASVPVLLVGPHADPPAVPWRRVVACLDGSAEAAVAVAVADRLRTRLGAPLELIEVVQPSQSFPPDVFESAPLQRAEARLSRPADGYDVLHGRHPGTTILEHLAEDPATIVVLGTRGRTGLASALVGGVARQVVGGAHGPVLVVPPGIDPMAFLADAELGARI